MSTPPVKSLIDEQIEQIERSLAIIGAGLPRDMPVSALSPKIAKAIQSGTVKVSAVMSMN